MIYKIFKKLFTATLIVVGSLGAALWLGVFALIAPFKALITVIILAIITVACII